ncbi:Cytochrome P450 monooxygenase [Psilocybe cubensis]|uniref:Cytochrome P450 monooxygenase n=2 Tax=Psilocybe cubensis TaxID=181762 RepID=A0ACB8GRS7_PSICU|nr:Cytochrome P450 monooxygenase [Psilocybe cubensis]KAH9478443.1 Cytochrome P450 monooxygenase [Psilocybe cubensis]
MTIILTVAYVFAVVGAAKLVAKFLTYNRSRIAYPPGPNPKPIFGNAFDFPKYDAAMEYLNWGKRYNSDILHAEALGNHVVILNKREDVDAILEQSDRAKLYSDRPHVPIFKIMGWEYNFAMLRYGDEWREHRKITNQNFNPQAAKQYQSLQLEKVGQLLQGLLDSPKDFLEHGKKFSIALTMAMMYGYEVKSIDDRAVSVAEEALALGTQLLTPGGTLINVIPALQYVPTWFPGAWSRRLAAKVLELSEEMKRIPTEFVKKSLAEGTASPSLVTEFYERKFAVGATQHEEDVINNVAFTVYGANPDVQRKAQAELDRVIGSKRLPNFDDRESLPYIEAIYREVLRFRPPVPIGIPHCSTQDDHYKGYYIPKGTSIFANIWALAHDEADYPEPHSFKPERFLDENGQLNDDDRILAYGFGRRVCVGKHVAGATMWILIASVLACFNITQAKDEEGNDIEINPDYVDLGLTRRVVTYSSFHLVFDQI